MKNKAFTKYYLFSCLGVLLASCYPLSMGVRVIADMIQDGTVLKENYPKYIIPYTPISVALIVGVLILPLCLTLLKRFALLGGEAIAIGVFFLLETLFEQKVVVTSSETVVKLENWQMYMCAYIPPTQTTTTYRTQTAIDILMGDYSPAFKLHFYLISVVLILTILNSIYGFGQMILKKESTRRTALILQSVCALSFLGLCILACFTAFWRDGNLQVSPISALLMTVFFLLLGVTSGIFTGSFLLNKKHRLISVGIPAVTALLLTLLMYVGELILLNGHLYSFGTGILYRSIPGIVFAPVDLLTMLAAGSITAGLFAWLNRNKG